MVSNLSIKTWNDVSRNACSATQIVAQLAKLDGWKLAGDGPQVVIEKTFAFANYFETMAFVNGLALVAHKMDHHPEIAVSYNRCVVRLNTHDARGISVTDFEMAAQIDVLLA